MHCPHTPQSSTIRARYFFDYFLICVVDGARARRDVEEIREERKRDVFRYFYKVKYISWESHHCYNGPPEGVWYGFEERTFASSFGKINGWREEYNAWKQDIDILQYFLYFFFICLLMDMDSAIMMTFWFLYYYLLELSNLWMMMQFLS